MIYYFNNGGNSYIAKRANTGSEDRHYYKDKRQCRHIYDVNVNKFMTGYLSDININLSLSLSSEMQTDITIRHLLD